MIDKVNLMVTDNMNRSAYQQTYPHIEIIMKIGKHPVSSIDISYKITDDPQTVVNNSMFHYCHMPDIAKTLIDIKKKEVQKEQYHEV